MKKNWYFFYNEYANLNGKNLKQYYTMIKEYYDKNCQHAITPFIRDNYKKSKIENLSKSIRDNGIMLVSDKYYIQLKKICICTN